MKDLTDKERKLVLLLLGNIDCEQVNCPLRKDGCNGTGLHINYIQSDCAKLWDKLMEKTEVRAGTER